MKLLVRIIVLISRFFLNPILAVCYKKYYSKIDKRNPLPPIENSILLIPAHKLASKIRSKELTSAEVVKAYIDRIEKVNPLVNCVVADCFKEALEEAKNVDCILASGSIPEKYNEENAPLLGVPFSCKECFMVKDMPCTTGVVARKNFRASEDADIVKNMRKAGAILLGHSFNILLKGWSHTIIFTGGVRTHTICQELSEVTVFKIFTQALCMAIHNLGSSGGEACLLSTGGSVIGIGSDIGGSIRMPSFFNGTYGHKSSYGLISNKTQYPPVKGEFKEKMLSSGPMCRYASDLRLLFKIHAGEELYQIMADKFEAQVDLASLNYYVLDNLDECFYATPLSKECRDSLNKAVSFVEASFNKKVQRIDSKKFKDMLFIWTALMRNGNKTVTDLTNEFMTDRKFNASLELVKSIFQCSDHTLHSIVYCMTEQDVLSEPEKLIRSVNELRKYFDELLGNNSIILSPGFPVVAPYHNQPVFSYSFDFIYFGIYNALMLPSTSCPMGLCPITGLPLGIQIVSNDRCDHLTISLAEYFEKNLIGWVPGF